MMRETSYDRGLRSLFRISARRLLKQIRVGLEREALRVDPEGRLSLHEHPVAMGSALTHPYITTDYSEAMLELVTEPGFHPEPLRFLETLHQYIYHHLDQEILWAGSMPCVMGSEPQVPLALYGESNLGKMKTVYRRGLGYRYGRAMQVISGIHYNFSLPRSYWEMESGRDFDQHYVSARYFDLIRNLLRYGWLVPYLFGASPAVCRTFVDYESGRLEPFTPGTYYGPYATSLRLGDIGYQNRKESTLGMRVDYNGLDQYIESLVRATQSPCPEYRKIGLREGDKYLQLNANLLQIENEYYGAVRPKCVPLGNEKPSLGLRLRGVEYVELRTLDINPFVPCGISVEEMKFLPALMLYCLLEESPQVGEKEYEAYTRNLQNVAQQGRDPGLMLERAGKEVSLRAWAQDLLEKIYPLSVLLAEVHDDVGFLDAWQAQQKKVEDSSCTYSGMMLAAMQEHHEGYVEWALARSHEHSAALQERELDAEVAGILEELAVASRAEQERLERSTQPDFAEFLAAYEAQG